MPEYKDSKTGEVIKMSSGEKGFPSTGAKILNKTRPPVAQEISTD